MDWESFYKWLEGKLWFQLFIVAITAGLIILAKIMMGSSSSTQTAKTGRMYASPPTVCYCHSCVEKREYSWRDFRGWHLSDKTFREAMHDLESLGLVKRIPLSSIHNQYALTEKGVLVASVFHETVRNLDALTKTFKGGRK